MQARTVKQQAKKEMKKKRQGFLLTDEPNVFEENELMFLEVKFRRKVRDELLFVHINISIVQHRFLSENIDLNDFLHSV